MIIEAVALRLLAETASNSNGANTVEIIAWIGIPLFLALCGAVFAVVKGSIRFAQYMTKSEQAQSSIASTNTEIRDTLNAYMNKTDLHLGVHDQEIAVLKYATGPNGTRRTQGANKGIV